MKKVLKFEKAVNIFVIIESEVIQNHKDKHNMYSPIRRLLDIKQQQEKLPTIHNPRDLDNKENTKRDIVSMTQIDKAFTFH